MMVGPSVSLYKRRHQTASRCFDSNREVLNGRKKRLLKNSQVRYREMNASEPVMKLWDGGYILSKARILGYEWKVIAGACLLAIGQTQLSRHESKSGFYMELRKSIQNAKRTAQLGSTHEANSTDVCMDDGWRCSSNEVLVMSMERRTSDIQF